MCTGMVFTSNGFVEGSTGYDVLTAITVIIVVSSTMVFVLLLAIEVRLLI